MILLRKFEVKWIKFGCTAAKSYLVVMYSHPMLHQCFAHTSLKNHSINFIFWQSILIDFRQIVIIFLILRNGIKVAETIIKFGCNISWWITVVIQLQYYLNIPKFKVFKLIVCVWSSIACMSS
jgi:hypothetical protein